MDEEVATNTITTTAAAVLSHRTEMKTMTAKRERERERLARQSIGDDEKHWPVATITTTTITTV